MRSNQSFNHGRVKAASRALPILHALVTERSRFSPDLVRALRMAKAGKALVLDPRVALVGLLLPQGLVVRVWMALQKPEPFAGTLEQAEVASRQPAPASVRRQSHAALTYPTGARLRGPAGAGKPGRRREQMRQEPADRA